MSRAAHLGIARPAHARILVSHSPPISCGPVKPAQGQVGILSWMLQALLYAVLTQQLGRQLQLPLQLPQPHTHTSRRSQH